MYSQHQKVILRDGREACILEIFDDGAVYLVEYRTPDGPYTYDDIFVYAEEILSAADEVTT